MNETDRELLELAAKAVGIDMSNQPYKDSISVRVGSFSWRTWDPLTDDGDALRLAVKLRIDVELSIANINAVHAEWWDDSTETYNFVEEPFGDDPYAATRRAIVRAAAEIGRTK